MSVTYYDGNLHKLGERGWLKTTYIRDRETQEKQVWVEAYTGPFGGRTQLRLTPDEAFRFALDILSDVSLAKFGSG